MTATPYDGGLHVVLVEPDIPWNTGNAGRTCLAAGAQLHLVKPLGFELDDKSVRRAGLDYWPAVNPTLWRDWASFESQATSLGALYFFTAEAEKSFWQARFERPSVLIFGREGAGLPAPVRERHRDRLLRLPMKPSPVRSLNLSTAVAVAVYEVQRQWQSAIR